MHWYSEHLGHNLGSFFSTSRRSIKKYSDLKGRKLLWNHKRWYLFLFFQMSSSKEIYFESDTIIKHGLLNLTKHEMTNLCQSTKIRLRSYYHSKLLPSEITAVVSYWLNHSPPQRMIKVKWHFLFSNKQDISLFFF